jgi:hypothetical protein
MSEAGDVPSLGEKCSVVVAKGDADGTLPMLTTVVGPNVKTALGVQKTCEELAIGAGERLASVGPPLRKGCYTSRHPRMIAPGPDGIFL